MVCRVIDVKVQPGVVHGSKGSLTKIQYDSNLQLFYLRLGGWRALSHGSYRFRSIVLSTQCSPCSQAFNVIRFPSVIISLPIPVLTRDSTFIILLGETLPLCI